MIIQNMAFGQLITEKEEIDIPKNNTILLEAFGHGFMYSLNYERVFYKHPVTHTSAQIGISYYGNHSGIVPLWMPLSINQSIKMAESNYIEFGVGKMFRNDGYVAEEGEFINDYQIEEWIFRVGYKHYFNNNWLIKVAYTPIYQDKSEYMHWGGISIGYNF
jgi:hypothetical protein